MAVVRWLSISLGAVWLFLPAAASAKDEGAKKRPKFNWKEVAFLPKEPTTCEFIETFTKGTLRWTPFTTDRSMKKGVRRALKKKTGKLGGNAVYMLDSETNAFNASSEAKAYWCPTLPEGAVVDEAD